MLGVAISNTRNDAPIKSEQSNTHKMLLIETNKQFGHSFAEELTAAGFPNAYGVTTRRIIDGKPSFGHSRAVTLDVDESRRAEVQAVIDAHVPFFGHAERKVQEVKSEANRLILAILPEWKQRNYTARAVEKVAAGEVGDDEWNAMQTAWQQIKAIRVASDAIEAEIAALTDEQAGQYDVAASPLWP